MFKKVRKTTLIAIVFTMLLVGCGKKDSKSNANSLTIKGSDTMVHLVSTWAEEFMKINPNAKISVTGGGSGTGIAALLNGTTEICAASRKMKSKEYKISEKNGTKTKEIIVAKDGIAVILNPNNPVKELSMEQLKKIFTGAVTNWNQLGGSNGKIIILSRESSSGTYVFFQKRVLKKENYSTKALLMPATSSIVQTVSTDITAIGYVGLAYALKAKEKVKILGVKSENNTKAVYPSTNTVVDGSYLIARPLQLYTSEDKYSSDIVKKFLDFALSANGQKIVKETGYIAIK